MAQLTFDGVRKSYGDFDALRGIDLDIEKGEFVVFVGPSGCGKSTLLRMIAGLESVSSGRISIDGEVVNNVPASKRGISMVFQSYALYPHMTVYQNMAFGLKIARVEKAEIDIRVRKTAEMLQLTPLLQRLPRQLSGGQRQRVAIGRAIIRDPKVFLFDEPLSNLDAALRVSTRFEIAKLHEQLDGVTMVYVTHDQVEAMTLADRIVVINDGKIEQVGSPIELYESPRNLFVARFIGSPAMNFLPLERSSEEWVFKLSPNSGCSISIEPSASGGAPATAGIRPENLRICPEEEAILSGVVALVEQLGEVTNIYLECGTSERVIAKVAGSAALQRGTRIGLRADMNDLHVFDRAGERVDLKVTLC